MKIPYQEGTWFAVPLKSNGFAVGLVARTTPKGKVAFCYFFGPRRLSLPTLEEVKFLAPNVAVFKAHVGDLSLIRGEWKIIGFAADWKREDWPMPSFIRREELAMRAWKVEYSDSDPNKVERESVCPYDSSYLPDCLYGSGAATAKLTRLLT